MSFVVANRQTTQDGVEDVPRREQRNAGTQKIQTINNTKTGGNRDLRRKEKGLHCRTFKDTYFSSFSNNGISVLHWAPGGIQTALPANMWDLWEK